MVKASFIAVSALILVLVSGCADEEEAAEAEDATIQQADQASAAARGDLPRITVSADKTHAVQPEDEITVSVSVEGFTLDESRIGQESEAGVGFYRIYLDEADGDDYLAEGAAASKKVNLPSDITDGSHELRVVLYNNDKTPFTPAVEGRVLLIVYRL